MSRSGWRRAGAPKPPSASRVGLDRVVKVGPQARQRETLTSRDVLNEMLDEEAVGLPWLRPLVGRVGPLPPRASLGKGTPGSGAGHLYVARVATWSGAAQPGGVNQEGRPRRFPGVMTDGDHASRLRPSCSPRRCEAADLAVSQSVVDEGEDLSREGDAGDLGRVAALGDAGEGFLQRAVVMALGRLDRIASRRVVGI